MRRADVTLPTGLRLAAWHREPARATGATFLLVHGLSSNARLWDGVAERLAELGHASVAVDLRGHGRSDDPESGYDVPTVACDLRLFVEALGADRPVAVGQSWGGNVALELAATWPGGLRGLACVDGGWIDLQERFADWEATRAALAPPRLEGIPLEQLEAHWRRSHPGWPEAGIRGMLENVEVRDDGTVAPRLGFERHVLALHGLWEHRAAERYPGLAVPVLLVPALDGDLEDDRTGSTGRERAITAAEVIPDATVQPMVGDHDLHAQHPVAVAELLHRACGQLFVP